MQLLSQDQRFQIATRLLDMLQILLVKETTNQATPEPLVQGNMNQDDAKLQEYDQKLEGLAMNFINVIHEGDEDGK